MKQILDSSEIQRLTLLIAVNANDTAELRRLIPLNTLPAARFDELCGNFSVQTANRGEFLFHQGDTRNEFVYLLTGSVTLQAGEMEMESLTGGSESARFALAHQIPRKVSALVKDSVRYVRIPAEYLNQGLERQRGLAGYEVRDLPRRSSGDWMTTLLRSPIFQRVPAANLQKILTNLQEIRVSSGQHVIKQDDPGDYYYIIKEGRCQISRKPSPNAKDVKLGELKTCDTFGEDALLSGEPRNVSVTMLTDGALLRLDRASFIDLVKEHVLQYVDFAETTRLHEAGSVLLDIRAPDLYTESHLPGSTNIPFFSLRMLMATLSRQPRYVVMCEDGRVSAAAAFLLIRNGIDAVVLENGLYGVPICALSTPAAKSAPFPQAVREERLESALTPGESTGLKPLDEHDVVAETIPRDYNYPAIENFDSDVRAGSATRSEPVLASSPALAPNLSAATAAFSESAAALAAPAEKISSDQQALRRALDDAQAELAALRREVQSVGAAKLADSLAEAREETERAKRQITELRSILQEYLDAENSAPGEELAALREENAMIRAQAESDVLALQKQLADMRVKLAENSVTYERTLSAEHVADASAANFRPVDRDLFSEADFQEQPINPAKSEPSRKSPWAILTWFSSGALFGAATLVALATFSLESPTILRGILLQGIADQVSSANCPTAHASGVENTTNRAGLLPGASATVN